MSNRLVQQKPNAPIKKEVIRARQGTRGAKRAQGLVVATSLAATMLGWVFFSHQDAELVADAQLEEPAALVASAPQEALTSPTPMVSTIETGNEIRLTPTQITSMLPVSHSAITAVAIAQSAH